MYKNEEHKCDKEQIGYEDDYVFNMVHTDNVVPKEGLRDILGSSELDVNIDTGVS